MQKPNVKPIKKFGQNFILNDNILERITNASRISGSDIVLEIGTGIGNLTRHLCRKAKFVYTVEKDTRLYKIAQENLREFDNVRIICNDIMNVIVSFGKVIFSDNKEFFGNGGRLKVVGNLPYYIVTPIIFKLFSRRQYIADIFITVQKEVARRIAASPGSKDYGILSCAAQFYTKPQVLFNIKRGAFYPRPKVDSAVLRMQLLDKPIVCVKDEKIFFNLIKMTFGRRRKTLLNSLSGKNALNSTRDDIKKILQKADIDYKRRPETLSLDEFASLAEQARQARLAALIG